MTTDPAAATFARIEAMTDDQAWQRYAELMYYASRNIALPDEELDEVVLLAAKLGRRRCLGWKDGREAFGCLQYQ